MKIYKNSSLIARQKVLIALSERLKRPGYITTNDAWILCKKFLSYSALTVHFRKIMSDMVDQGLANRTISNGRYLIVSDAGLIVDELKIDRTNSSVKAWINAGDLQNACIDLQQNIDDIEINEPPLKRPPAVYSNVSREQTIEKYLSMNI